MNDLFKYDYDLSHLKKITTKRYGFDLFVTPRFKNHYVSAVYEEVTGLLVRQNARGVNTFIDIGAHYGFYDVLVGLSNPGCKILAFEPVPENREILQKNILLNAVEASVCQFAVSDRSGHSLFQISEASDNSGFIANPAAGIIKNIEVEMVKLDQYLNQIREGPVLIKIDTDGHELKVLDGMGEILEKCKDLRLVVEFNPKCLKANGESPQVFIDRLGQLGFDVFVIHDVEKWFSRYPPGADWMDLLGERTRNFFCIKKDLSINVVLFSHSSVLSGSERSLLELVTELIQDHGAICTVCLPGLGPLKEQLENVGAATMIGEYSWWCTFKAPPNVDMIQREYNRSFNSILILRMELEKIVPDVIFSNTLTIPWGAIVAVLLDKPHVWRVSEFGQLDYGFEFYLPFLEIRQFILNSSNVVAVNSEAVGRELFSSFDPKNLEVVHTNIELPAVLLPVPEEKLYFDSDSTRLLILGTITWSKGQEDAVLAAIELIKNRACNVELAMAGIVSDSGYLEHLKLLATDAQIEDHIHFDYFKSDIFPLIAQADIMLVCSRNEAFGRLILEAMLMKKPVIGTNTGGTLELIRDGETGLLYEPGNIPQLADQIQTLIDRPELRGILADQAHDFIKGRFTRENFGGRYYEIMKGLKYAENPINHHVNRIIIQMFASAFASGSLIPEKSKAELAEREQQLQAIYQSHAWNLIKFFRLIKSFFIPLGSRREKIWYSLLRLFNNDKT